jgi:hypothetical protein
MGPAGGAARVSEQKSCETAWGVFAITAGIVTRPRAVAQGVNVDLRDIDRRERACASEARQLHRIPAVRVAPIPGLCGHE